jgi:hypothetical protein
VSKPSKTKTKLAVASSSKAPPKKLNTQGAKATTAHGNNILSLLFQHFPELAKGISAETLCLAFPAQAGVDANTSPLSCLTDSPDGRNVLQLLAQLNTALAPIIAKSLNPSACQINNYSSLSIFSASSSSHNTLTTDEETGMNPVKRGMLPD